MGKAITSRSEDYSQWYNDLVLKSELADYSAVRGCMIIRPYGFTLWEHMRDALDKMFKDTGHVNAYFPLLCQRVCLRRRRQTLKALPKNALLLPIIG
jgi:prolyl-tRNA synthetase